MCVASSRSSFNPLMSPVGRLERICEILGFPHHLTVAKLHNAHRVCRASKIRDTVFGDPKASAAKYSLHVKA